MTMLPRADEAVATEAKVRGYLLNPDHTTGTNKATVFMSALGVAQDDWTYLRDQLLAGVRSAEVTSTRRYEDADGYTIPMMVVGLNGQAHEVITAWKVPDDGGPPCLVTAYAAKKATKGT